MDALRSDGSGDQAGRWVVAAIRGAMATLPLPSGRGAARVAAIRGAMAPLPSAAGSAVGLAAESVSGESGSPLGRCLWGLEWR